MKAIVIMELPDQGLENEVLYLLRKFGIEHEGAEFEMYLDSYQPRVVEAAIAMIDAIQGGRKRKRA
jgi:hypothetical protein